MTTSDAVKLRELGATYEDVRTRIGELVSGLDADKAATPVPACPEWSVKDVVAHVTGNCADIINGNLDGVATTAWTEEQVESRKHLSVAEVLAEWDVVGPQIAAIVDDFPGRLGQQLVGDLTVHEHDLRGALGLSGARDSQAIAIAVEFMVETFLRPATQAYGLGPLEVQTEERTWIVGTGERSGDEVDQRAVWQSAVLINEPATTLSIQPVGKVVVAGFELFRAISSRRSASQIRAWDWSVDPEPYLRVFDFDPFTIRADDLIE